MKGKFLFATLSAALLMTACANDEITASRDNSKYDPNSIQFSPVVPYASRAEATTTDNIEEFVTWAYEDGVGVYMDGVTVTKGSSTWAPSTTYYWPDANLSFYSLSPVDYELTLDSEGTPSAVEFEVAEDPDEQVDFIYAVNMDEEKSESPVLVNFRHALSQVAFKAQNTDTENLKVVIEGIEVDGIAASGSYTLPAATTAADDATEETRGSWDVADDHTAKYTALSGAEIELTDEVSDVISDVLFLLPQEDEGWDNVNDKTNEQNGSYFSISCHLSRVLSGGEEITIWPTDGNDYAYVSVPVAVEWEEGYSYTYTIIFGEGMGYYPPDYNDDPSKAGDPIPVLTPISFTVTVDDFIEVSEDVSMEADENETEPTSLEPLNKAYPYYKNAYSEGGNNSTDSGTQLADDGTIYNIDEAVARLTELKSDGQFPTSDAEITDVEQSGADYAIIDSEDGVFLFSYDEDTKTFEAVEWITYQDGEYFGCVDLASDTEIEYYTESGTYTADDGSGYTNNYSAGDVKYIKLVINTYYRGYTNPDPTYLWKVYTREFSMEEIKEDQGNYNPDDNDEPKTGKLSGTYTSIVNTGLEGTENIGNQLGWVNPMYTHGAILSEITNITLRNIVWEVEADYGIFDAEGGVFLFKYDSVANTLSDPVWLNNGGSNYSGWGCVGFGEESGVTLDANGDVVSIYMEVDAYYDQTTTPDPIYLWKTYYRTFTK